MGGLILLACCLIGVALSSTMARGREYLAEADRIRNLPEVIRMPDFPMYSGYLDVSEDKKLHYWLNICEDQTCDTLIVWFNGGPGCSSMDGLFSEHGPYKFDSDTGQLVRNEYSWNILAHTLYIEAPAGVGFSYVTAEEPITDDTVAQDLQKALLSFYQKFHSLSDCDLYISGESYAGVYIPTLLGSIIESKSPLTDKIQGLMIGNGLLHSQMNDQSLVYYAYFHGLFGNILWDELLANCCEDSRSDRCDFYQFKNEKCMLEVIKVIQIVTNSGLNVYNLYGECASSAQLKQISYFKDLLMHLLPENMKVLLDSSVSLVPPCSNATFITKYLNSPELQQSIHVRPTEWELCNDKVHSSYKRVYHDMSPFLKGILQETNIRILLYFGDVDMACNHIGGEWFVDSLDFTIKVPRKTWSVERNGFEQIAGFVKEFDKLTFATIKGAGHMVPADDPQAAYQMIQRFLDYEPL